MATDEVQSRTTLFRTPLSCALLTGALTIAISEGFRIMSEQSTGAPSLSTFLQIFLCAAMELQGPVLYRRDQRMVVRSFVMALALAMLTFFCRVVLPWEWFAASTSNLHAIMRGMLIRNIVSVVARSSLLGILLAQLYRVRNLNGLCSVLGIVAVLPVVLLFAFQTLYAQRSAAGILEPTRDMLALYLMFSYLTTIAVVVLPTIPIERALRRQQAQRKNKNAPREAERP